MMSKHCLEVGIGKSRLTRTRSRFIQHGLKRILGLFGGLVQKQLIGTAGRQRCFLLFNQP